MDERTQTAIIDESIASLIAGEPQTGPLYRSGGFRETKVQFAEHAKGEVRLCIDVTAPSWKEAAMDAVECRRFLRAELAKETLPQA